MLPFFLQLENGSPVSDQILQAVRKAMLTGLLKPGDEFPSVRTLSQELRISPTTAHKVVLQLKAAGWLASRPGIGMVITVPEQPALEDRRAQISPSCKALLKEAAELNLTLEDVIQALRDAADSPTGRSTPSASS